MYLTELFKALGRRWYLLLLGIAGTAGLSLVALELVPPTYEAKATVVLLPPERSYEDGGNPYLVLGGLNQVVDVLIRYVDSDSARAEFENIAPTGVYTVEADAATNGPVFVVSVEDKTAESAIDSLSAALDSVPRALEALQFSVNVPSDAEVTAKTLAVDSRADLVVRDSMRAVIVSVALGLACTAAVIAIVDSALNRRNPQTLERDSGRHLAGGTGGGSGEFQVPMEADPRSLAKDSTLPNV